MAAFGAVLRLRLDHGLSELAARAGLPSGMDTRALTRGVAQIQNLTEPLRSGVMASLADSIAAVFTVAAPLATVAFGLSWLLKELPLREVAPARWKGASRPATSPGASPAADGAEAD